MASNFKNSAGTDLDSLFLVNNSNAGAIGFKMSDSTDLGNRYSNASTKLQQTIGYKNSAGTDIGYLRSNLSPTSSGSISVWIHSTYWDPGNDTGIRSYDYASSSVTTIDGVKVWVSGAGGDDFPFYISDFEIYMSTNSVSNVVFDGVSLSYRTQVTSGAAVAHGVPYLYRCVTNLWSKTYSSGTKTLTISFQK